jgi:cysteine desulfurase
MTRAYLDHNATSPLRPDARRAMLACLDLAGNASSVHEEGRAARDAVEEAREGVAAAIGCAARQVVFTSGGTEANVTALSPAWLGEAGRPVRLFVSAVEHPSVLKGGQFRAEDIAILPVDADGVVDPAAAGLAFAAWHEAHGGAPFLVSVMLANNETGAIQPVAEIASVAKRLNGVVHCDAVQAFGKMRLDAGRLGADLLTISAHKAGGPKGAGALAVLREGLPVAALMRGGGQEAGYRAGTENVAAIAGFGAAAGSMGADFDRLAALRDRLEAEATKIAPRLIVFSRGVPRLPNTSCFAVAGMDAETLLMAFDLGGVAVSSGSACSSGKVARSHVLEAMGAPPELAAAAIRVSLGWSTGEDDIERFLAAWAEIYGRFAARKSAA